MEGIHVNKIITGTITVIIKRRFIKIKTNPKKILKFSKTIKKSLRKSKTPIFHGRV